MTDPRKQTVASGYDRMARRYLEWSQGIVDDPRHRMLTQFARKVSRGARVLDLGCGAGIPSTRQLARRFAVVGVDISSAQVALAKELVPEAEFIQADFTEIAFPEAAFHGVVALYAISHVPRAQHARLLADVYRWLAPGGVFLATLGASDNQAWTGEWLGEPMFFSGFDAAENRNLLRAAGFELEIDDIEVTHEPEGDVDFVWILARKPAAVTQNRP